MSRKSLYEYAVLHHKETEDNIETELLIKPTIELAKDERSLGMMIARKLPESLLDDLDNIEIIIRPF